ncbi:MAG: PilZ domain-containing protein [Candidatus Competibacteraceae bacterium]
MSSVSADLPAPALVFTGCLPLAWQAWSALPGDAELRDLEQTNLTILHTLFALEIHVGDFSDDPAALMNATELKRLDFKVGLLLEMIGQLFARQQAIPPEHLLTLTVNDLTWQVDGTFPVGSLLRLELYCNLSYPRPLILYAQVAETTPLTDGHQLRATFHAPSEALQEALERFIFLRHRHAIAYSRRSGKR